MPRLPLFPKSVNTPVEDGHLGVTFACRWMRNSGDTVRRHSARWNRRESSETGYAYDDPDGVQPLADRLARRISGTGFVGFSATCPSTRHA
jgi:hypothetical protein